MRVVHVTDLHVSSPHFDEALGERAVERVNREEPDLLVVTGDLTMEGLAHEFVEAETYLERFEADEVAVVPGNHDARNVGYELFTGHFGPRWAELEAGDVTLVAADSSEPDLDEGHIGRENYARIRDGLSGPGVSVFAMHHHLVPVPGAGRERSVVVDAGDLLRVLREGGADLVLTGHRHVHNAWVVDGLPVLNTGALATTRVKARQPQGFTVIDVEDGGVSAETVLTATGERRSVL